MILGPKKLSIIMVGVLTLGALLSACGKEGTQPAANSPQSEAKASDSKGMPIAKDKKITLKMAAGKSATTAQDWSQVMLWQEYEKMTNIHVDWELIPFANLKEKRNILLAGGDYPDAFFTALIPNSELIKYGSQGVFKKLNDLIDKNAPNLKKMLDSNPNLKKGLTMPDGSIYSFPLIYDPKFTSVLAGGKMWLQKEWMDKLGLKEPETIEDFYQLLKAFKEKNPNGKGDVIPYAAAGVEDLIGYLKGSWGLGNRGARHPNVDVDPATNELRFIPTDPKYKEVLQFVKKLYDEKLVNEDIFTIQDNQFYATGAKGVYGSLIISSPFTVMNQKGYVGANSLKGPYGDKMWSNIGSPLATAGAFVITDKNKYPVETVRWLDYLYGDEGSKMFFMGFEGKSYEVKDGKMQYTKEITENPNGLTLEQALVKYVVWPGGGYPNIVSDKFFKGAESLPEAVEAAKRFTPNLPKEIWSPFTFTLEENDRINAISADISTYMSEMRAKFITGKTSFAEWDNYVATLKKMKLDEYMQIYKKAYDRYKQS